MIREHEPWTGNAYANQPVGSKLLIVGFSHHGSEEDHPSLTNQVVGECAMNGKIRFFNTIAEYFGESDRAAFWSRVAFANTLGTSVGDDRYGAGTQNSVLPCPHVSYG